MSAYALPGSLFPLIGSRSSNAESISRPLRKDASTSVAERLDCDTSLDSRQSENETKGRHAEVGIAVKSGRLDPSHLVKQATRRTLCCHVQDEISRDPGRASFDEDQNDAVSSENTVQLPHGDAVQFELSISLNGRDYSATRTLPRILQLRNELVREFRRRRQGSSGRLGWRRQKVTVDQSNSDCSSKDDDTVETVDEYSEYDDDVDVTIPELPDCIADNADGFSTGVAGNRGFRLLQALIHSYCPVVERWLRLVADIVPPSSSPCLMKFLWEPLSQNATSEVSDIRALKRHSFFSTSLDSIDEYASIEEERRERSPLTPTRTAVA